MKILQKIKINKEQEALIKNFAQSKKISFEEAKSLLFKGVLTTLTNFSQKKVDKNFCGNQKQKRLPLVGVDHLPRIRKITIIEVEVG